jgi:hypothetical protein
LEGAEFLEVAIERKGRLLLASASASVYNRLCVDRVGKEGMRRSRREMTGKRQDSKQ